LPQAVKASPDIKDAEYLALALKRGCVIWSEDQPLRQQDLVRVLNTKELLKELNLI
jgi:predicted nucleic acid-binding protein